MMIAACGLTISDEERIGTARTSMLEGDYRAAEIHLKSVLNAKPDNLEARLLLATVHLGLNDLPAADKEALRAAELGADKRDLLPVQLNIWLRQSRNEEVLAILDAAPAELSRTQQLRYRGEALLGQQDGPAAEDVYREWLVIEPKAADAVVGYAKARALQGDFDDAGDSLNRVIENDPAHTDALLALAILQYGQGNYVAARDSYQRVIETGQPQANFQRFVFALIGLADSQLMLRDVESARESVKLLASHAPSAPHTLLQKARLAQLDHDDLAAERALQQLVSVAGDNVNALMLLGSVQWRLGYFQQAEVHLSRAVALAPDNLQARKMWALIQLRRSNTNEAVEILEPLLDEQSEDAELYGLLAVADLQRGQSDSALDMLLLTAQRYPDNIDVKLQLAEGYRFTGNPQKAVDILLTLDVPDRSDFRRERILITSYMDLRQPQAAYAIARGILSEDSVETEVLVFIGQMYMTSGSTDLARDVLNRARADAPRDIAIILALAALEERANQPEQARTHYESAIRIDPENLQATLGLAQLASAAGDNALASKYLLQAREQHPGEVRLRLTMAVGHLNDGRFREARALAREIARIGSEDPFISLSVGKILLETGAVEEAQAQFELANRLAPESVDIITGLSRSLMAQGNAERAHGLLQRALTLDPQSVQVNSLMALAEIRLGQVGEATARTARLRAQNPGSSAAMVIEGELNLEAGNYEQAATAFNSAADMGAGERAAIREFEARLKWQNDQDPTRPLLDWIAEHPRDVRARTMLAQHYTKTGSSDKAVRLYEALLQTDASNPVFLNNLAWEYQSKGDLDTALALAIKAREIQPDSGPIADTLGWIYRAKGDHEKSARLLREATQLDSQNAEIRYHLAVVLAESGIDVEAAEILADIIESGQEFASRDAALALHAEM